MRIRGFTLLELVLVLGILAALTAVAVRSMDAIQEQARYDDARRGMDGIDAAVVGVPNEREADGSAMATGFVADVGRLPRATGADPATQLQELWANPANLLPFAMRPAPSDAEVIVGTGWRGTYLRLGIGRTTLTDGWGRPYDLLKADAATPVAAGDEIVAIRSRGADGLVDAGPAAGYDPDILLSFAGTGTGGVPRYAAAVSGRVF
jgi:prepilin-type N-terminal cleavage/methylation domain-containing protein